MKAYILSEDDFEKLLLKLTADPKRGTSGGSSQASARDPQQEQALEDAYSFYNYHIRTWITEVKK